MNFVNTWQNFIWPLCAKKKEETKNEIGLQEEESGRVALASCVCVPPSQPPGRPIPSASVPNGPNVKLPRLLIRARAAHRMPSLQDRTRARDVLPESRPVSAAERALLLARNARHGRSPVAAV